MARSRSLSFAALVLGVLAGCGGDGGGGDPGGGESGGDPPGGLSLGEPVSGVYHLGPVDWEETQWHNACAPYPTEVRSMEGAMLAGLSNTYAGDGSLCDACIEIKTERGKKAVARVVTYGVTNGPGDIDVSQTVYDAVNEGEDPRNMTWQLVACGIASPVYLQFQTGANEWWTSFWVRNPNKAVEKVEVKSANHADFFELRRQTDGTLNDDNGFGAGAFTLKITAVDGSSIEESFDGFTPGSLVAGTGNL